MYGGHNHHQDQIAQNVNNYRDQRGNNHGWQENFENSDQLTDELEQSLDEIGNNENRKKLSRNIQPQTLEDNERGWRYDGMQKEHYQNQYQDQRRSEFQNRVSESEASYKKQIKGNFKNNESSLHRSQLLLQKIDNKKFAFDNKPLPHQNNPQAIPLLTFNGRFEFNYKIHDLLDRFEGKYQFVTIIGNQSSNKSEFINNMVSGNNYHTDDSTRGVWIYTEPLYYEREDIYVFFLESQGFSGDKNEFHSSEKRCLLFSIMISSHIIYYSDQGLDLKTLKQIEPLIDICSLLHVNDKGDQDGWNSLWEDDLAISYYLPAFAIVFKDTPIENQKVLINSEFEQLLATIPKEQKYEQIKMFIKKFKDREAYGINKSSARNYQQEVEKIRDKIKTKGLYKEMNGVALNSRMVVNLIAYITQQINRDHIKLHYDSAWKFIVQNECIEGYEKAYNLYNEEIQQYFSQDISRKFIDLYQILKHTREMALQQFIQTAAIRQKNEDFSKYKIELTRYINEKEIQIFNVNEDLSDSQNSQLIQELIGSIKSNLNKGRYNADNLDLFISDFERFLDQYEEQAVGSNQACSLIDFLKEFHVQIITKLMDQIQDKYQNEPDDFENAKDPEQQILELNQLDVRIDECQKDIQKFKTESEYLLGQKEDLENKVRQLKSTYEQQRQQKKSHKGLSEQKQQNDLQIKQLRQQIADLQKKNKKGCCGCFG